jgi:hypothetical protein
MKLLSALLAVVTLVAFSGCASGIVERKVPAHSCCSSDGKCVKKHHH